MKINDNYFAHCMKLCDELIIMKNGIKNNGYFCQPALLYLSI